MNKIAPAFGVAQLEAFELLLARPHLLWSNVERSSDCWLWSKSVNDSGYGSIRLGSTGILAHRAAYFLSVGSLAASRCICHECDTPRCCRPGHLFVGTHAENMADMRAKGRRRSIGVGEANGRAKLSTELVKSIRERRLSGASLYELAGAFGVGLSTISRACRGENWK